MTLGAAIRRIRSDGRTAREFAAAVGITPEYLSHVEADRKEASLDLLKSIFHESRKPVGVKMAFVLVIDDPPDVYWEIAQRVIELEVQRAAERAVRACR